MARKPFYFSSYINESGIITIPVDIEGEGGNFRYSIHIPFIDANERSGKKAIVILKNPSKAGKYSPSSRRKLSDDTVYSVLDYLYKHETNFSEVIILNLFALYASVFNDTNVNEQLIYSDRNIEKNNKVINDIMADLKEGDRVIVAWGGYPKKTGFRPKYKERIGEVLGLLEGIPLWRVGDFTNGDKFPQHGLDWVDFEEMKRF
jgi:hypothetical protein